VGLAPGAKARLLRPFLTITRAAEVSCEQDLRILAEMAFEIRTYKCCGLPNSLRSLIKTKRGKDVALLLEEQSIRLIKEGAAAQMKIEALESEIDGLRNENQQLTDQLLDRL
jgi:hypothetical protein